MKDLPTELRYLTNDAKALEIAIEKGDLVFARRLILALRETVGYLEQHAEQLASERRFTVIEVN